jgi:hypothetical protein
MAQQHMIVSGGGAKATPRAVIVYVGQWRLLCTGAAEEHAAASLRALSWVQATASGCRHDRMHKATMDRQNDS